VPFICVFIAHCSEIKVEVGVATSGEMCIPDLIGISSAVPTSNNAGRQMYLPAYLFIHTHTHTHTHTHAHAYI